MAYTIDTINTESYGLYVATSDGLLNLPEGKEQIFVVYGREGYQVTKRKGKELDLKGFLIASSLVDFKLKVAQLQSVFTSPGLRAVVDNHGNAFNCFCRDGFKIDKVYVPGQVYAQITLKMKIISETITPVVGGIFNNVFNNNFI